MAATRPLSENVTRRVLLLTIAAGASTYILCNANCPQQVFLPSSFLHRSIYPQQLVIVILIGYLGVDLAWYHPDVRIKHLKQPKTTTTSNNRHKDSFVQELFSSLPKPPSFSIDVAEDVMTIIFMVFILVSADVVALRNMNGMISAIVAKIALKVVWHTTTSIVFGEGQPSGHVVDWMETSYLSPTTTSTHGSHEKQEVGHQPANPSSSKSVQQQSNPSQNHDATKKAETIGKPASHPSYWLIHGHEYDLEDFIQQHPGGKEAILLGRGRDCTALFESYHSFTKLNRQVLRKYRCKCCSTSADGDKEREPKSDKFYDLIRKRVLTKLAEEGIDPIKDRGATPLRATYYLIIVTGWIVCGYHHVTGTVLGSFSFAVLGWLMGAIGHDGGHFAVSRKAWVNEWCVWSMSLISNHIMWQHQHTYSHHSYTNEFDHDPDLHHFHLMLRVHEKVPPNKRKYGKQSSWVYVIYSFTFVAFATCVAIPLFMLKKGHLYGVVNFQDKIRPKKVIGLQLHVTAYGLFVIVIPLFTNSSPLHGLLAVYVHIATMGVLFGLFSQINHLTEIAMQSDMDTRKSRRGKDSTVSSSSSKSSIERVSVADSWAAAQVETSNNFANNSLLSYIVSNGLNFQIEHHLFPGLNHCHLHHIAPVVRKTCEEYGVNYRSYDSWREVMSAMLEFFAKLSTDNHGGNTKMTPSVKSG